MEPLSFGLIAHASEAYQQMLRLRILVLLRPIGISDAYIQVENEKTDYLLGAFQNNTLIACCVVTPRAAGVAQLRQMAVLPAYQGKRIGAQLLNFAEATARQKTLKMLCLHAREPVVDFYKKSGYRCVGLPFDEVGITHRVMEKKL